MSFETIILDIRGQVCPSCLLLTLREVNRHHAALKAQAVELEILTDSRDATGTIPETLRNMGLTTKVDKLAGHYRIVISRPAG